MKTSKRLNGITKALLATILTVASTGLSTGVAHAAAGDPAADPDTEITTDRATGIIRVSKCNTDTFTKYVKKGDANKIKVYVKARACSKQIISRGNVLCSYLTSWNAFVQPESDIDFLDGNVKTEIYSWGRRYDGPSSSSDWNCLSEGGKHRVNETWGGNYKYDDLFDDHAKPRVYVQFGSQAIPYERPFVRITTLDGSDWTF